MLIKKKTISSFDIFSYTIVLNYIFYLTHILFLVWPHDKKVLLDQISVTDTS